MSTTILLVFSVGASLISFGSIFYIYIHRRLFCNSCKRKVDCYEMKIVEEKRFYDIEQGLSTNSDLSDTNFADFKSASFTSDLNLPRDTIFAGNEQNTQSGKIEKIIEVQSGRNDGRKVYDVSCSEVQQSYPMVSNSYAFKDELEVDKTNKETISLQIPSNHEILPSTENNEESSKTQEYCDILNSSLLCMVQNSVDDKSDKANKNAFQEVLMNHETEIDETNEESISHQITCSPQKLQSVENDEESSKTQEYCKIFNSNLLCMVQNSYDDKSEMMNCESDLESIQSGEYDDSTHGVSEVFDETIHTSVDESTLPSSHNSRIEYDEPRSVEDSDTLHDSRFKISGIHDNTSSTAIPAFFIRDDSSFKSNDPTENFFDDSDSEATSVTGSRWIQSSCSSNSVLNSGYEGEYGNKHEDIGDDEETIQVNDDISELSCTISSVFDYEEEYKHKLGGIKEGIETSYDNDEMSDVSSTFLSVFGHEEEYEHKLGHVEEEDTSIGQDEMSDVSSTFLSVFGHKEDKLVHMDEFPSRYIDELSDITSIFSSELTRVNSEQDSFTYSMASNHSWLQNDDGQIELRNYDKENPPQIKEKATVSRKCQKPKPESFTLKSRQNVMRQNRLGSLETVKEVQEVESRPNELQYVSSSDDDESPITSYQNSCVDKFSCDNYFRVTNEIPSTYLPRSENISESIPKAYSQDREIIPRSVEEIFRGSIHNDKEATPYYTKSGSFEECVISLCESTSSSMNVNISCEEKSYSGKPLSPTTDLGSTYSYNDHTDIVSELISLSTLKTSKTSHPNLCPICSQETTIYQSVKYTSNPLCIHMFHSNCMINDYCPICTNTARDSYNGNKNEVRSSVGKVVGEI